MSTFHWERPLAVVEKSDPRAMLHGFDPLEVNLDQSGLERNIAQDAVKREVLNILKSYTGYFDCFSEMLQNALDALDARAAVENFEPKLWIKIDVGGGRVAVIDNGIGMNLNQVKFCFRPNVSFKARKVSRGHKGVGATFLAYGFSAIRVFTKTAAGSISGQMRNGRQWAEDHTDSYPRPVFESSEFNPAELANEKSGTCVEILIGDQRPQLPWLLATSATQWYDVLRIKTPLGGIYLSAPGREQKTAVVVEVLDLAGTATHYVGKNPEYYYPHEMPVLQKVAGISEIEAAVAEIKGDPSTRLNRLNDKFRRLDAMYEVWSGKEVLADPVLSRNLDDDQRVLVEKHNITVYGCFVSTAKSWSVFQKDSLKVRANAVLLRGGLQLASDFMPQGDLAVIPLTSTIGYQANTHVIIHLTDGNPDMGRKVFQPEIKTLGDELARRAVDVFKRYLALMREDTGISNIQSSRVLWEFKKQQEEHLAKHPLQYRSGDRKLSIMSEPQSEQDVVALFHELLGLGLLQGLGIYATSESEKYDCIFQADVSSREQLYSEKQPLGVSERALEEGQSPPWVLEYKFDSDSLIADFSKELKHISDVRLLVCWAIGAKTRAEFTLRPYLAGDEGSTRQIFGTTHAAYQDRELRFDIIALQDLLAFVRDPDGESARQRQLYLS
ncbi:MULTISPECIES: ATP-binding protein [Bradyrhizobium]|uniref:ATP-binding protein n=1 Tax=Bradyrhizobium elkanii TaxID=29448 RepID=UPI00055785C3|nr:ATP-binding protein [Bradyrhizobium elkanii]